jgi:hypothetical protein
VNGVMTGSIAATEADYTVPDIFFGGVSASVGYFTICREHRFSIIFSGSRLFFFLRATFALFYDHF